MVDFRGWTAKATHLCAGGDVGQAVCFGDSGGSLIKSTSADLALAGDVSFDEPRAKGFPDVLTAAHCVANGKPGFVSVGTHYNSGTSDGEQISVVSSTSHPSCRGMLTGFDVAVLKLSRASKFAPSRSPRTHGPSGKPSSLLKENTFVVKSNAECQAKLRTSNNVVHPCLERLVADGDLVEGVLFAKRLGVEQVFAGLHADAELERLAFARRERWRHRRTTRRL
ncbi:hypothetical protein DYB31_007340 [Aphanomyces astaci]|uniref:Peptidase S1 domain-containing protein n=1 Tax=Aphanomyces astaci TaxID=112090 RepID=A0A397EX11_APHAT|nr:hypothetical protein DYB31_007340 [Aphanomyces astaci]